MTFLISTTFTDALARLTADEQKFVKTTAFDLQLNPANPGHQFHRLRRSPEAAPGFFHARMDVVERSLRIGGAAGHIVAPFLLT